MFINDGKQGYLGRADKTINIFREQMNDKGKQLDSYHSDVVRIKEVSIKAIINQYDNVEIETHLQLKNIKSFYINIPIHRDDGIHCCSIMSDNFRISTLNHEIITIKVLLNNLSLMPGNYYMSITVLDEYKIGKLAFINQVNTFKIIGSEDIHGVYSPENEWRLIQTKKNL